jgi:putative heme iron utilization protein
MSHGRHDPLQHLNEDHADDLLVIARAFGGHPDATAVRAERLDTAGVDLVLDTPDGPATARVDFAEPVTDFHPTGLRHAFADLTRRAHAALAAERRGGEASAS